MVSFDGATLEIINWDKYNPRTDSKKPSWFRMDNTFLTGPKYFDLTAGQKLLGALLMSLVSQQNGSPITLNYPYLNTFTNLTDDEITEALEKYIHRETFCVSRARSARVKRKSVRILPATDGRTDEDGRTETDDTPTEQSAFDFESVFKLYPRRIKVSEGIRRAQKVILTQEEFDHFHIAVQRYAGYCDSERTPEKYIMHPTTFVEKRDEKPYVQPWRDWVSYVPNGKPQQAQPSHAADRRSQGNQASLETYLKSLGGANGQAC